MTNKINGNFTPKISVFRSYLTQRVALISLAVSGILGGLAYLLREKKAALPPISTPSKDIQPESQTTMTQTKLFPPAPVRRVKSNSCVHDFLFSPRIKLLFFGTMTSYQKTRIYGKMSDRRIRNIIRNS